MKNILIINSSAFTIGDIAIIDVMLGDIKTTFGTANITIESANLLSQKHYIPKDVDIVPRLYDAQNINIKGSYVSWTFLLANIRLLFSYLFDSLDLLIFGLTGHSISRRPIFDAFNNADIIISAGGDAITPHYGYFLRIYVFWILRRRKKPIVCYASTIGPFKGITNFFVIHVLRSLELVLARDKKSYDYLVRNGVSKSVVKRTADTVILLDANKTRQSENIAKQLNLNKKTVCIFLKTNAFSAITKEAHEAYLKEVAALIREAEKKNYQVVFMAANNADQKTTEIFLDQYNIEKHCFNTLDIQPSEFKSLITHAGIVISSRMHPVIIASTAGIPVIGVSNETKMPEYLSIIGRKDSVLPQAGFRAKDCLQLIEDAMLKPDNNKINTNNAQELASLNQYYLAQWAKRSANV